MLAPHFTLLTMHNAQKTRTLLKEVCKEFGSKEIFYKKHTQHFFFGSDGGFVCFLALVHKADLKAKFFFAYFNTYFLYLKLNELILFVFLCETWSIWLIRIKTVGYYSVFNKPKVYVSAMVNPSVWTHSLIKMICFTVKYDYFYLWIFLWPNAGNKSSLFYD